MTDRSRVRDAELDDEDTGKRIEDLTDGQLYQLARMRGVFLTPFDRELMIITLRGDDQ